MREYGYTFRVSRRLTDDEAGEIGAAIAGAIKRQAPADAGVDQAGMLMDYGLSEPLPAEEEAEAPIPLSVFAEDDEIRRALGNHGEHAP